MNACLPVMSLLILTCLSACQSQVAVPKTPGPFRIIGYVRGHAVDNLDIRAEKLTHINFAFANVVDGRVVEGSSSDSIHYAKLRKLKQRNPQLKLLYSAGGWSWSDGFSDAVLTPQSREIFAQSTLDFMQKYKLDGIDLDWEYPGLPGDNNPHRPEDKENFTLILKLIREKLDALTLETGERYLLTIATGAFRAYLDHTEMEKAQTYLDFINVMSYDYRTGASPRSGHHTNFAFSDYDSSAYPRSTVSAIEEHLAAGIPPEKLVMGVAFYGRGWPVTDTLHWGAYRPTVSAGSSYAYQQLVAEYINQAGYVSHWDSSAQAPFLWHPTERRFISYDDPESLQVKAQYIREKGLGGAMFWEYSHDPDGVLLGSLHAGLQP